MSEDSGVSLDDVANGVVSYVSLGTVGYGKDGFEKGYLTHGADEVVGEVTGRNSQRAALNVQKDQIADEKAAKKEEIANNQVRKQQQDITSSTQAGSYRATAAAKSGSILGTDPTTDFLGL